MFTQFHLIDRSKAGFGLGGVRWRKGVLLAVLLATLMVLQIASSQIAWALPNSLRDAGFESGSLNYGWHKWGYPHQCCGSPKH